MLLRNVAIVYDCPEELSHAEDGSLSQPCESYAQGRKSPSEDSDIQQEFRDLGCMLLYFGMYTYYESYDPNARGCDLGLNCLGFH